MFSRIVKKGEDRKKLIVVILYGRQDPVLHKWMQEICAQKPDLEYVYQLYDYRNPVYFSTTKGNIGNYKDKDRFEDLVSSAAVALVSARADHSGKYGFVTPRIYETASFGCHLIGRYPRGKEREVIGIDRVCSCVETFEEFSDELERLLSAGNVDFEAYDGFLRDNEVSKRVREFMDDLL